MYKAILDLGNINQQMKLKFNLIILPDEMAKQVKGVTDISVLSEFVLGHNTYLRLCPRPFLTIDISKTSDKNDAWNSNLSVNIGPASMHLLEKKLKILLRGFEVKDLYYTQNGRLFINQQTAQSLSQYIKTSNKTIKLAYCVVHDEENPEVEYEGISFMINSVDNFCLLTYHEMEFLLYQISHIDLYSLSVQLINTYLLNLIQNSPSHTNKPPVQLIKTFSEKKEEIPETVPYAKVEEPEEIPKI